MGALLQALEMIFEMQMRRSNGKKTRTKNKLSNSHKVFFSLFSSFFFFYKREINGYKVPYTYTTNFLGVLYV